MQNAYSKEFALFKPDKRLKWLPLLGTVSVELELQDRTVTEDVPPLAAALIELFSEKRMSSCYHLSSDSHLTPHTSDLDYDGPCLPDRSY